MFTVELNKLEIEPNTNDYIVVRAHVFVRIGEYGKKRPSNIWFKFSKGKLQNVNVYVDDKYTNKNVRFSVFDYLRKEYKEVIKNDIIKCLKENENTRFIATHLSF